MSATPSMNVRTRSVSWAASDSTVCSATHFTAADSPDDAHRVVAARLVLVREELRLRRLLAHAAGAAFAHGAHQLFHPGPQVKEPRSGRPEQPLMTRSREQVDEIGLHVDRHMAGGLRRVDDERHARVPRDPPDRSGSAEPFR